MSIGAKACILGVAFTLGLLACSIAALAMGFDGLAHSLLWQHGLLLDYLQRNDSPDAIHFRLGGTPPIYFFAFVLSIFLGFVMYGVAWYGALRYFKQRT